MLPMIEPRRIFIKCQPEWSYNYIGSIKDFIDINPHAIEFYYTLACRYLTVRHNFISGHLDNQSYTRAINDLYPSPLDNRAYDGELDGVVKWACETLYRLVRPILLSHPNRIQQITYTNNDQGDIIGLVVHYQEYGPTMTSHVI